MDVKKEIRRFPDAPGVYLMKDKKACVLYVGKAASLIKRVGSYFQRPQTAKIEALLQRINNIEYIQTSSAAQALLLENSLIKKYQPYYNVAFKDDKSYPFVKINTKLEYPNVSICRGRREKGVRYYGPYTNVQLLKIAIKTLRAIFPFRSCRRLPKKACLYLHLKLCPGMCVQKIDKKAYRENLVQLEMFLQGRYKQLIKHLSDKMHQAAKSESFEEAALLRDRIAALSEIVAQTKESQAQDLIMELKELLNLTRLPRKIEAFDVSEISGVGLCGSMVSFVDGFPDKNNYRKFRIKTVKGIDDYAMICELLQRRYSKKRQKGLAPLPDLVVIDGGKGHLSCARRQLDSLGLRKIPVISLAKRLENIYTPQGRVLSLPKGSRVLHLLQRIRDEAHRFAISYHRKLRQKGMRISQLDGIPGIAEKRKKILLRRFKSVQAISRVSYHDLLRIQGIDRKTAESIIKYLKKH